MDEDFDIPEEFQTGIHVMPVTPVTLKIDRHKPTKTDKKTMPSSCRHKNDKRQEDKQCTFKPKINSYKSRNLQEFLEFQRGFVEKKETKLARIKQELNQKESMELTCKPNIDNNSKRLANKQGEHVFSRLSRQKQQEPSVEITQPLTFQPQILGKSKSLSRQDNVSELLYSDAQRRIEKQKITARESTKKRQTIPRINNNTDRFVLRTIRQEFEDSTKNCSDTSPIIALSILSQIFNIDLNPKKDAQTEGLCEKVLKYLITNENQKIPAIPLVRLWHFIESVMGKAIQQDFSREEQNDIYRNFGSFYRSRMTKSNKPAEQESYSFQPQILKNSQKLAAKKRQKMQTQANAMISQQNVKVSVDGSKDLALADLYILERMHKQQLHQQQKLQRESKQLRECTFTPKILRGERPSSRQSLASKQSTAGLTQPYKTFKLKSQADNTLGTLHTQYSEKSRSSLKRSSISKENKIHEIKDIEKTVQRLSTARKNREFDRMIKERGYPKDINNWEGFRNSQKKAVEKALRDLKGYNGGGRKRGFVFDVHIGNGVIESIEVAPGQSPSKIIESVAYKHGFDQCKKSKLLEMMNYHLRQYIQADKENQN